VDERLRRIHRRRAAREQPRVGRKRDGGDGGDDGERERGAASFRARRRGEPHERETGEPRGGGRPQVKIGIDEKREGEPREGGVCERCAPFVRRERAPDEQAEDEEEGEREGGQVSPQKRERQVGRLQPAQGAHALLHEGAEAEHEEREGGGRRFVAGRGAQQARERERGGEGDERPQDDEDGGGRQVEEARREREGVGRDELDREEGFGLRRGGRIVAPGVRVVQAWAAVYQRVDVGSVGRLVQEEREV